MPTHVTMDPHWAVGDLLEHARTLAAVAAARRSAADDPAVLDAARDVRVRCVRLDIDSVAARAPVRRRDRLAEALDRLACAADDLVAVVVLRCTGAGPGIPRDAPDLPALLARVTERHDHVVASLGRAGVRRTSPGA